MLWVDWLILIFTILTIFVVIVQESDEDAGSAFSGEVGEGKHSKLRGRDLFLARATGIFSSVLVILIIISNNQFRW
jgi:protein translocase SecG subunit